MVRTRAPARAPAPRRQRARPFRRVNPYLYGYYFYMDPGITPLLTRALTLAPGGPGKKPLHRLVKPYPHSAPPSPDGWTPYLRDLAAHELEEPGATTRMRNRTVESQRGPAGFRFLDLPLELRTYVYEYVAADRIEYVNPLPLVHQADRDVMGLELFMAALVLDQDVGGFVGGAGFYFWDLTHTQDTAYEVDLLWKYRPAVEKLLIRYTVRKSPLCKETDEDRVVKFLIGLAQFYGFANARQVACMVHFEYPQDVLDLSLFVRLNKVEAPGGGMGCQVIRRVWYRYDWDWNG